jgi:hypothetical protein
MASEGPSTVRSGEPAPSAAPTPRPTVIAPLAPERYRFQTTIGGTTLEKLRLAQDLLSHSIARGDDDAVLQRALDALLVRLLREKFAITDRRPPGNVRRASIHATFPRG